MIVAIFVVTEVAAHHLILNIFSESISSFKSLKRIFKL